MSSKTHQHKNDIVTSKVVEQLNSLTNEVAVIKSDSLHNKETLQLEIRTKKSEVLQENATKMEQHKRNIDQEIADLRAEKIREDSEMTKKIDRRIKAIEEATDSKINEVKKGSQTLINGVKTEMLQNFDTSNKEVKIN
uniref:Uncharacterized protein n=1 Tax=Panagrolaimus superbus TaxID=310955 RepID=A0A914YEI2_9BILA